MKRLLDNMALHRRQHALWIGFAIALSFAGTPRVALAHAHLVKSAPAAGAHVASSPKVIQLWFSEAAEATMTTIALTGPNGARVPIGPVQADASDPLLLAATVGTALPAGSYVVTWRTIARDDGHPSNGSFTFVVNSTTAATTAPGEGGNAVIVHDSILSLGHAASVTANGMGVEAPSYVAARWLDFAAIIIVLGAVAFAMLVVPRAVARNGAGRPAAFTTAFMDRAIRRAATLGLIAGMLAVVASIWRLYAERAVIGEWMAMRTVLHSAWGQVWISQLAVAVIVCITFALARSSRAGMRGSVAWIAAAAAALVLGATPSFSGHAIAATAERNFSVALDVIHVIAAGGWVGGLFALVVVGIPAAMAARDDADSRGTSLPLIASLVSAFSPLALVLASTVIITGAIAAWLRIGSFGLLFHSTYGTVLLIKLAFVALVLAGGAFNWRRMRIALADPAATPSSLDTFRRSAWIELSAAVLVIAATAVLVATQPPIR